MTTAHTSTVGQAVLDELAQQPVLALGEVVGQLLDDVRRPVVVRARARRAARRGGGGRARRACAGGPSPRDRSRTAGCRGGGGPTDRRTAAAWARQSYRPASAALTSSHERVERRQVGAGEVDATLARQRLDRLEAAAELGRRGARRQLGVDVGVAGDVDGGHDEVAELVGDAVGVAGRDRLAQLGRAPRRPWPAGRRRRASRSRPWPPCGRGAGRRPARAASGRRRRTPTCGPSRRA